MNTEKVDSPYSLKTAVLFLVFNRPDTTMKVFEKIRQAKPYRLYLGGDGPREGHDSDKEKVIKVREILNKVDWPCEVKTLFRDNNLGCKKGVSSAIDWFFENEEQGIILEDDCLPHIDFFSFCEDLLNRYAEHDRVSIITGGNFQNEIIRGDASYYFSKYPHIWGWATWKRTWNTFDRDIKFWPEWKNSHDFKKKFPTYLERKFWKKIFNQSFFGKVDSWGYPLFASILRQGGLAATPNFNLISNIGFGEDSTHTKEPNEKLSNLKLNSIGKLIHPQKVKINLEADNYDFKNNFIDKNSLFPKNLLFFPKRLKGFLLRKFYKLKN